jgi:hypothetical protein
MKSPMENNIFFSDSFIFLLFIFGREQVTEGKERRNRLPKEKHKRESFVAVFLLAGAVSRFVYVFLIPFGFRFLLFLSYFAFCVLAK